MVKYMQFAINVPKTNRSSVITIQNILEIGHVIWIKIDIHLLIQKQKEVLTIQQFAIYVAALSNEIEIYKIIWK